MLVFVLAVVFLGEAFTLKAVLPPAREALGTWCRHLILPWRVVRATPPPAPADAQS